jgi:hypothetical protein
VWLSGLWDRFDAVTGQSFVEFVPKLLEVSCYLATLSTWLTAPHGSRPPHEIALGSFALSLLISGILAPATLKPPSMDLREWKKTLLDIFCSNADVGYQAAPLAPRDCMLVLLLCTGSTVQQVQECAMQSVQDFTDVSRRHPMSNKSEHPVAADVQSSFETVQGMQ